MKTRIITLLCAAALLPVLGGCGDPWSTKIIVLDMRDNGTTVNALAGDRLIVLLQANPSTGYDWQATIDDTNVLSQAQEKFVAGPASAGHSGSGTVGVGGTDVFEFDTVFAGTTTLTLQLLQAGQPSSVPASSTFSIRVQVTTQLARSQSLRAAITARSAASPLSDSLDAPRFTLADRDILICALLSYRQITGRQPAQPGLADPPGRRSPSGRSGPSGRSAAGTAR